MPPQRQAVVVARHKFQHTNRLTTDTIIDTDNFVNFLTQARGFCGFIESDKDDDRVNFLSSAQNHLKGLYFSAKKLPEVDLIYNKDFDSRLSKTQLDNISKTLAGRFDDRFYWHVFNPIQESDLDAVCGDIHDDLVDIYKELQNSLLLFDEGEPAKIETAVWTFKWSYDNHWGNHCINAIYALHYFLKNLG